MLNIFQSIRNATHRIEPFHSQFLGDALRASLSGDRALFDAIWNLCAPADWASPLDAEVTNEFPLDGAQRIDLLIVDKEAKRAVGIEVKTSRASARPGQLERYLDGLRKDYQEDKIAIAFLTPFNYSRAKEIIGDNADTLPTVRVFELFRDRFERSRHVSWLDIAEIEWGGGEIWRQHRAYVYGRMAAADQLRRTVARNRSLDDFFGAEAVEAFWEAIPVEENALTDRGVEIDLCVFAKKHGELARALAILINDDEFVVRLSKLDHFKESSRQKFLESDYGEFHHAMFALASEFPHVWVQGKKNYGLRVAHKNHSTGVSLVTSQGFDRVVIGRRR